MTVPEGDTVWRAAHRLHQTLAGHVLTSCDFRVPQLATTDLAGFTVSEVVSRGKHMLTRLVRGEETLSLHTHFLMDGSWHIYPRGEKWRGGPAHTVRVVLKTASHDVVGYAMPVIDVIRTQDEGIAVGHLGTDIMAEEWSLDSAVASISAEPTAQIGDVLLDQRLIAGIGNLYRCEVLFIHRVTPWTLVADVDVEAIIATAVRLMHRNRWEPRQITTGDNRRGHEHFVHARGNRPCRRCSTAIVVNASGVQPQQRLAYWCPKCQGGVQPTS